MIKTVRKNIARVTAVLLMAVVFVFFCGFITLPKPTEKFYVNDNANVLSSTVEQELFALGKSLEEKTTAQLVLLTVQNMEGLDRETFALQVARTWGIGQKDKDNGVLLLLAIDERQTRIEVGYGLEGRLNDAKCGRILDNYAIPSFKNDDFETGLKQTYLALAYEIAKEYGIAPEELQEGMYDPFSDFNEEPLQEDDGIGFIIPIIVIVLLTFIFNKPRRSNNSQTWRGGFGGFGGGGFSGGFGGGGGGFGGGGGGRGF